MYRRRSSFIFLIRGIYETYVWYCLIFNAFRAYTLYHFCSPKSNVVYITIYVLIICTLSKYFINLPIFWIFAPKFMQIICVCFFPGISGHSKIKRPRCFKCLPCQYVTCRSFVKSLNSIVVSRTSDTAVGFFRASMIFWRHPWEYQMFGLLWLFIYSEDVIYRSLNDV